MSNLATSLEKAAAELKKEGHSEDLPDATAVARAVEQALQKHFGMASVHASALLLLNKLQGHCYISLGSLQIPGLHFVTALPVAINALHF